MTATVCVVGCGVAGTAAAIAAARCGAQVTVIDGGTGASTLATGAIDRSAVPEPDVPVAPPEEDAKAAFDALDAYVWPKEGAAFLTTAGIVRRAVAGDAALLDVARLRSGRVGVVDCRRPGWDAPALAAAWGERFAPLEAAVLRYAEERAFPDADFAARHDDPDRIGWLAERLREALTREGGNWAALVLPASLGVARPRASDLTRLTGVACGEALGLPGGPSGLRFEKARDGALRALGVERVRTRATAVEEDGAGWRVVDGRTTVVRARAVVIAIGGLIGGGLEYAPAEVTHATAVPHQSRPFLRLTIEAPVALAVHGRPLTTPASLFGFAPEVLSWPWAEATTLELAGVSANGGLTSRPGICAAGDVVADVPRTWLGALEGGARAGLAAARAGCR